MVVLMVLGDAADGARPEFSVHRIDAVGTRLGQTALVDLDKDGDLDWISGCADHAPGQGSQIWWWEYQAADRWIRHALGQGKTDVGAAVLDVNGDGWPDVLSGSRLLIHPGDARTAEFRGHDVGTLYSHDTVFADMDGDGCPDALANSDRTGLWWYSIPSDPTQPWTGREVVSAAVHKVHGGVSPHGAGDLDGDGDTDIATAQAWYENADGRGLAWTRHDLDFGQTDRYGVMVKTWIADLDSDGDADVVQAEGDCADGRVAWFQNDGRGGFRRHLIKDRGDRQDFHSLVVADFDLDGDLDVFSGGGPLSAKDDHRCYVWENLAGPGRAPVEGQWLEHVIARKPCHEAVGGDVDGDGDVDVCFKPWSTGNEHVFLRNLLVEKRARVGQDIGGGEFAWTTGGPVVHPRPAGGGEWHSVKDPSIVLERDTWHLFCTVRGTRRSHAVIQMSFTDWAKADEAERRVLECHPGFFCAPQVFYFRPHQTWYLICQASDSAWSPEYQPAFATTRQIADPGSWTPLRPMFEGRSPTPRAWLDFWVICDAAKAHLFFTSLDGKMWRCETALNRFPEGWSEPLLALQGDVFEASHTYRLRGQDRYLTLIEAQNGHGWRYYKAYLAERLEGPWQPLAAEKDHAFASMMNVLQTEGRWTDSVSHGELLRAGNDERLEVEAGGYRFLIQGVLEGDRQGKAYGQIPWRLGLLTQRPPSR